MELKWAWKSFESLELSELYALLRLRSEVFVVEQDCVYQDIDNHDQEAKHLLGFSADGQLIAYVRVLPAGAYFERISIGRVITALSERGKGLGIQLMQEAMDRAIKEWGEHPIQISAQEHLQRFYENFGFHSQGETYLEDGIPHIRMDYLPKMDR